MISREPFQHKSCYDSIQIFSIVVLPLIDNFGENMSLYFTVVLCS